MLGAIGDDLGFARYGGCDVQSVGVISWLDSEKGQGWSLVCFTGAMWV